MLGKGLGVLMLLALPFISFSWDCNTDLLGISYYYDGNVFNGSCQKYVYQDGAFYSYDFSLESDPSSGGSSGGSSSVNLCSDLEEFNNLLLGIKQGLLKVFLASAFLVGLASASATVMRVKGWI